jgi:dTDP-4-dehydrorhamnose reductase
MKILLTGYTGELGLELVEQLSKAGIRYSTLGRQEIYGSDAHFFWSLGMDPDPLVFQDIDILIHLAWITNSRSDNANHLNIGGSSKLITSAHLSGVKVINVSSLAAENPQSNYGLAKLKVEDINHLGINVRLPKLIKSNSNQDSSLIRRLLRRLIAVPVSSKINVTVLNLREGVNFLVELAESDLDSGLEYSRSRQFSLKEYLKFSFGFSTIETSLSILDFLIRIVSKIPIRNFSLLEDRWISLKSINSFEE